MVRPLGGSKYELINFNEITRNIIIAAAQELVGVLEHRPLLECTEELLEIAKEICNPAMRYASMFFFFFLICSTLISDPELVNDVFPFQKLPLELREKIYELAMIENKGLRYRLDEIRYTPRKEAQFLSLFLTCRQFYQESKRFLWSNNLHLNHWVFDGIPPHQSINAKSYVAANAQRVSYEWLGGDWDG